MPAEVKIVDGKKPCATCRKVLPVSCFGKSSSHKSGLKPACRDCRQAANEKDYAANKEKRLAKGKRWREENRERMTAARKAWVDANKEKFKKLVSDWGKNNPDARNSITRNYRARKRAANGRHGKHDVALLLNKQQHCCAVCKDRLASNVFHVDHIIPLSKGGDNDIKNLQILCAECNLRKSAKDPIQFMQENGFLL